MDSHDLALPKKALREQAKLLRDALTDKDEQSREICRTLVALPEYQAARTVLYYVDARSEVRTRHYLPEALESDRRIAVPYCVASELELFHLQNMDELARGQFGILEPKADLRSLATKRVEIRTVDLIVVPGIAFDRRGGRLGHGFGYYDKLLRQARGDTCLVGLAFECQLVEEVPMAEHDVFLDRIVTEVASYSGQGRIRNVPEPTSGERDGERERERGGERRPPRVAPPL